jgi:hypothetical protein
MSSVLSKERHMNTKVPKGATEGGTNSGDFHCWIEDMNGNIVFDPVFDCYKMICKLHGLDINKPKYYAWNNQHEWCKKYDIPEDIKQVNDERGRKILRSVKPMPLGCRGNCIAHFVAHLKADDSKYIIRIGSMGWVYKKNPKKVWWEYG